MEFVKIGLKVSVIRLAGMGHLWPQPDLQHTALKIL